MQVRDLFDHAALRAVLTVSESELPESVLCSYNVEDDVTVELNRRVTGWQDIAEDDQLLCLRLFAKYFAASVVATTASIFVLKKETDGNNEAQRSDKDGFAYIAPALREKAEAALRMLFDLQGVESETAAPALLDRVVPTRDIITQARGTV